MLLPPQHMEIENIYGHLQTSNYRTIAVTAANPGEGVTSLATALAQRNLLSGNSTLIIDLNLYRPSFHSVLPMKQPDLKTDGLGLPQLVTDGRENISLMGITAPKGRAEIMKLRKHGVLESCLAECLLYFNHVIIDTSPINRINGNNIPAERVAAACEAVLMVVLAGHTRENAINQAAKRLTDVGANLAGCVINDRDNPPLKSELLRETRRLEPVFKRLSKTIQAWIQRSQFLTQAD